MTDFHPGQFVACVDDAIGGGYGDELKPAKGKVYTVRSLVQDSHGLYLRLVEIVNAPKIYTVDGRLSLAECAFDANAFLPLDPKRLDIFRHTEAPTDRVPA